MLQITIPTGELYDESKGMFIYVREKKLQLEHSLMSISKWESKWHKSYLDTDDKTEAESLDYIRCMTINKDVDDNVYQFLTIDNIKEINEYINDPMTATHINDKKSKKSNEILTSELIYYWMVAYNIPFECEKWHISRLLVLIRICSIKNEPPKKQSKSEILRTNAIENAKRRARLHTKG